MRILLITTVLIAAAVGLAQTPPPNPAIDKGAYRVGGGVSAPVPAKTVEPDYTTDARKAGLEGKVELVLVVDETGVPKDIRVSRSLEPDMDQKAIEALQRWRFRPGMKDGKPVPVQVTVVLDFRLK